MSSRSSKYDSVEAALFGLVEEVQAMRERRRRRDPAELQKIFVKDCPADLYSCDPGNLPGLDCPTPDPQEEPIFVTKRGMCFTKKKFLESLPGYGTGKPPTIATILNYLVTNLHQTVAKLSAEDPQLLTEAVRQAADQLGDGVVTKPAARAVRAAPRPNRFTDFFPTNRDILGKSTEDLAIISIADDLASTNPDDIQIIYDGSERLAEQMNALKTDVAAYGFDRIEGEVLPSIPDGDAFNEPREFLKEVADIDKIVRDFDIDGTVRDIRAVDPSDATFTADQYTNVFYPVVIALQTIFIPKANELYNIEKDKRVLKEVQKVVEIKLDSEGITDMFVSDLKITLDSKTDGGEKTALLERWQTLKTLRTNYLTEPTTMDEAIGRMGDIIDRHIASWRTLQTDINALVGGSKTVGFVPMVDW